jgi:hypothetical protein
MFEVEEKTAVAVVGAVVVSATIWALLGLALCSLE